MNIIQTNDRLLQQIQTNVKTVLDPIANNLITQGHILSNVQLINGTNIIPTGLDRKLLGWIITRLNGTASIYDSQNSNLTPTQNLILVSSANVIVDIYVF